LEIKAEASKREFLFVVYLVMLLLLTSLGATQNSSNHSQIA
jgi:hypothetical protein